MPLYRPLRFLVLAALLGWLVVGVRPAQGQPVGPRYSFSLRGAPLSEALQRFLQVTRLDLAYPADLVEGRVTGCVIRDARAEHVLACILGGTGLTYRRQPSGLYVLVEGTAPTGTLIGTVADRLTGETLPDAHVVLSGGFGTITNAAGRFTLPRLRPGSYRLTVSYLGYVPREDSVQVLPDSTVVLRVGLRSQPLAIAPIVVDGLYERLLSEQLGKATRDRGDVVEAPGAVTPNVLLSLGGLAGLQVSDATAELHVQGGETGEHLFLLDGAPVFMPLTLGTVIGPFSPFAIDRFTVHKAGFGAEQGSQIAGVIAAQHAVGGGPFLPALDVQVDPLSVNARLQNRHGTPEKVETRYVLAGRVGLWDVVRFGPVDRLLRDWNQTDPFLLAAFYQGPLNPGEAADSFAVTQGNPSLGFVDAHGAMHVRFGQLRSLYGSAYWGKRDLNSDSAVEPAAATPLLARELYTWNNGVAQVRYERVLNGQAMASLRLRGSYYYLSHDYDLSQASAGAARQDAAAPRRADDGNRVSEVGLEARLDFAPSASLQLEAGLEPVYTTSAFLVHGSVAQRIRHKTATWRVGSFATSRLNVTRRLLVEAGSRFTYLATHRRLYLEPRLALRIDQPDGHLGPWSARLAGGLYRQFTNQFDVTSQSPRSLLSTNRIWLPVDASLAPAKAWHASVEALLRPAPALTVRLEAYYKQQSELYAIDYTTIPPLSLEAGKASAERDDLSQGAFLSPGDGTAYGGAAAVERQWRRARLRARYDRSHAVRRLDRLFADPARSEPGAFVPLALSAPWNEPHRLELGVDFLATERWTLLARWRGLWGRSWAFRRAYYDMIVSYQQNDQLFSQLPRTVQDNLRRQIRAYELYDPDNPHSSLPPLYQLDLSAAYTRALGPKTRLQLRLDLINVLDHANVVERRLVYDEAFYQQSGGTLRLDARYALPFTPSAALRLRW